MVIVGLLGFAAGFFIFNFQSTEYRTGGTVTSIITSNSGWILQCFSLFPHLIYSIIQISSEVSVPVQQITFFLKLAPPSKAGKEIDIFLHC